ncbi:BTAD domain-containing putative transcriptional regulator [Dactylosporangium sp. CA-139066]|uniref:AfsR/SARP family transcriptional regulator n=1 Tax=Dactylosporangium sp. CA-139066 TaxID=3239930 RepID=UPI003D8FE223
MVTAAQFEVLGPLAVSAGGRAVPVSGSRAQRVLAALLLHAGRPVDIATLVDYAWDDPPSTARQQIHTVVYRLRRLLGERVQTVEVGYRLDLDGARLDADDFARGVLRGRTLLANADAPGAAAALREALELWRGRALAGLPGERLRLHGVRLEEERLAALEECAEIELGLGRHRQLVGELQAYAAEHPLRERIAALLITALTRDGRQADAIAHYHRVVATLRDELGVEPGPALRDAYLDTLRSAGAPPPAAAPGRLPRAPRRLVGRDAELRRLLAAARDGAGRGDRPRVVVVDGMAGVGKSALALTAAHALAEGRPGARLYIDLHGHSEREPVDPHEALGVLLRQLGAVPPPDGAERAELWAGRMRELAGVVVLDNAAGAAQVEPLLPPQGPSVVVVTSRTRLGPIEGAAALSLEPLGPDGAVELLRDTADERVDDDPGAATAVAGLCGGLPLALRLVGHRLRHRPRWTVGMLAEQLSFASHEPIRVAAEGWSTAAAFDLSYRALPEPQQRLFRRLGLHPAGTLEAEAAAVLAEVPVAEVRYLLDDLVEVNLVQADVPGRYRLHDLLRAYAETLVADEERHPAIVRMLEYYLGALGAAGEYLEEPESEPEVPAGTRVFATSAEGTDWILEHWPCLRALVELSHRCGEYRYTLLLARLSFNPARTLGYSGAALALADRAVAAADALGDDLLAARTCRTVAGIYLRLGRYGDCHALLERSQGVFRRHGAAREALMQQSLQVIVLRHQGLLRDALDLAQRTVAEAEATGDTRAAVTALAEGGTVLHLLGRPEEGASMIARAWAVRRDRVQASNAVALGWLGSALVAMHRPAAAGLVLMWTIGLKRLHGNLGGAAEALAEYGRLVALQGDPEAGLRYQRQAYDEARRFGDGYFDPIVANHLGETLTMLGRTAEAVTEHERVLRDAGQRMPYERARAHAGLAAALRTTDPARAGLARALAVAEFAGMGLDEAAIRRMCP